MEDKRTALAIFLSIILIVVYSEFFLPKPQPLPVQTSQQNAADVLPGSQPSLISHTQTLPANISAPTPISAASSSAAQTLDRDAYLKSPSFTVETELYKARFSYLGGRLVSFRLKQHAAELKTRQRLNLVSVKDAFFPLGVSANNFNDAGITYSIPDGGVSGNAALVKNSYSLKDGSLTILLEGNLPDGNKISKQLIFRHDSYLFDLNLILSQAFKDNSALWLEWIEYIPSDTEALRWNPKHFEILEGTSGVTRIVPTNLDTSIEKPARWAGLGDSYFAFLLLGQNPSQVSFLSRFGETFSVKLRGTNTGGNFQIYSGPKDYERLHSLGNDLYKAVDLGYFAFVGEPILIAIHFLYNLLGNYGLAIVLLTLIIKALLLPLTKTSFKSMKAMQDLQPEMQELRSRIKDPTQLNKEVMALYQKRGVNPLGGCFPILLQMPIFLGMYNALQRSIDLRHAEFALWINDLSAPEGLEVLGITVPVMILLMGASMLWQQITTPTTGDPAQKRIMYMVPVIFTVMFVIYPFPSGLVLYWLVNNIISIVQQMSLRGAEGANPLRATIIGSIVTFVVAFLLTLL